MVYSITYRRPAHVSSSGASFHSEKSATAESVTSRASCPYGIPDALSFDRIIDGGTCPVSSGSHVLFERQQEGRALDVV